MIETTLSAAQKMTIDIAISSLDFLKAASQQTGKKIDDLTREDLLRYERREVDSGWNDGESDSDWSDRVECGEYDPITDEVYPR